MPWDYPGFDSEEDYVRFMVPRIGLTETARALGKKPHDLLRKYPQAGAWAAGIEYAGAIKAARAAERHEKRQLFAHKCPWCGVYFEAAKSAVYCSKRCKNAAYRHKVKMIRKAGRNGEQGGD